MVTASYGHYGQRAVRIGPDRIYAGSDFRYLSRVQELCESRGGRPELSVLTSLLVSVDVKLLGDSAKLVC